MTENDRIDRLIRMRLAGLDFFGELFYGLSRIIPPKSIYRQHGYSISAVARGFVAESPRRRPYLISLSQSFAHHQNMKKTTQI